MSETEVIDFQEEEVKRQLNIASKGQRLANSLIDFVIIFLVGGFLLGLLLGFTGQEEILEDDLQLNILSYLMYLVYYFLMEVTTGKTVGKMITKTRVVDLEGGKPSPGQILGRSFARFIPFEAFSFLGESGIGWHDSLPGTRVIAE